MTDIDVTVIGGGAAGLMAAVSAARCGARTRVIEHMDRIGKRFYPPATENVITQMQCRGFPVIVERTLLLCCLFLSSSGRRIPCACLKSLESIRRSKTVTIIRRVSRRCLSWKCLAWNAITSALICGRPADCNPFKKPVPGMKYAPQKARFQPKQ